MQKTQLPDFEKSGKRCNYIIPDNDSVRLLSHMYLLEGSPAPDHATIARFRTLHFAPNANKYTFVWKKAVTKNLAKLLDKLADFVAVCEEQYGIKIAYQNKVSLHQIKKLRMKLYRIKAEEGITFVHGFALIIASFRNREKCLHSRKGLE